MIIKRATFICLVFFLIPLSAFSQVPLAEEESEIIERPNIDYTAADFRDPFSPQILISKKGEPEKAVETKEVKPRASELFSLSIQGIIWNSNIPLAIINNQVFKKGEVLPVSRGEKGETETEEVLIMDINKDGVTIVYSGEVEKLPAPAGLSELHKPQGGKK